MNKRKEVIIGFVVGLIANSFGTLLYILIFSDMGIMETFQAAITQGHLGSLLALGAIIQLQEFWAPNNALAATESLHRHQDNRMGRRSPIASFYNAVFDSRKVDGCRITQRELDVAEAYGISLQPNRRYPHLKRSR